MPFPSRVPVRSRHAHMGLMRIAIGVVIGVSWGAIAGCSSPSRGPEVDIVEVERIEVLPSETTAAPDAAGESTSSSPASDGAKAAAGEASAAESGNAARSPAEEVPAAPAAN